MDLDWALLFVCMLYYLAVTVVCLLSIYLQQSFAKCVLIVSAIKMFHVILTPAYLVTCFCFGHLQNQKYFLLKKRNCRDSKLSLMTSVCVVII